MHLPRPADRLKWLLIAFAVAVLSGCKFDPAGLGGPSNNNNVAPENCGDGTVDPDEECDDGNTDHIDGCSAVCRVEQGWTCSGEPSVCDPTCGDGQIVGGEECDDNNSTDGDGCSSSCRMEPGWSCHGEPSQCEQTCGNSTIDLGETCDDGNMSPGDGCSASCLLEAGWACTGEPSVCVSVCGDGYVVGDEVCDDGDRDDGDGCSSVCQLEDYSACAGEPSVCFCATFVNRDPVAGPRDGGRWERAFATVQEGIDRASQRVADWGRCEVWVAEGAYHIYVDGPFNTVNLRSDVQVYGGFLGNETSREARSWELHVTTLNGSQEGIPSNVVNTVVTADTVARAILDGFVVTLGNNSGSFGGGMYATDSQLGVANCQFMFNTASYGGGLATNASRVSVTGSVLANNAAAYGAGLYLTGGSITLADTNFVQNTASSDGGGAYMDTVDATATDCLFSDNGAYDGGGMYLTNGGARVERCEFVDNSAIDDGGGLMTYYNDAEVTDCTFDTNSAEDGGGLFVVGGTVSVDGCGFQGNTVADLAGGLYVYVAQFVLANSDFISNTAVSGGGIFMETDGLVTDCVFDQNQAGGGGGGGIYFYYASPTVERCTFSGNTAAYGGGVYLHGSSPSFLNAVMNGNYAPYGGGYYNYYGTGPSLVNCTLYGNFSDGVGWGAAIRNYDGHTNVANSILWGNSPDVIASVFGGSCAVTYSDVQGGDAGTGNIEADPLFVDAASGDFHLLGGSPCIDAADGDAAPTVDMDQNGRVNDPNTADTGVGSTPYVDMGAFEYQPP